ncbi:ATP-grasp fold amidoligase family protein [Cytobacillus sp. FSL R5-0596]|uniref:ATP-grasp fold amidoligase family protein n=1 Tax=Cytobacillus sp. FSL R5-0596 TaxID=2954696 RepID=UPI0030F8960A
MIKSTVKKIPNADVVLDKVRNTYKRIRTQDIPDQELKKLFFKRLGYHLNLDEPKTFNEKLQWLKLNWKNPLIPICVDKLTVRDYVKQKGLGHTLNELIGVYENIKEIDFNKLPEKFVLKATHGSGWNIVCNDKKGIDWKTSKRKLKRWMNDNYYYHGYEWVYKEIKPRIISEKFLEDKKHDELLDYKFMCFNGEVKCLFICSGRNKEEGLKVDFYDVDWNLMPFYRKYPNSGKKIPKPEGFNMMIEYAKLLSEPFPFVRVDFYEVNGKIYFGELTFFPGSGLEFFSPESYDNLLGSWIELPSNDNFFYNQQK